MAQIIKTISLSKEEDNFVSNFKISPTRLIRNKLQEMMEFERNGAQNKELLTKIQAMRGHLEAYVKFLTEKGLIDEYLEQEDKL